MRIERAELRVVSIPLIHPFETSFGRESEKTCLLLRLDCEGAVGWGECVAMSGPWYSEETTGTARLVLAEHILPLVVGRDFDTGDDVCRALARVRGNRMAQAALETACLDALARSQSVSLAQLLGGVRTEIESGVSIGIQESPEALVRNVERELSAGYKRIKIKIKPGADHEYVRAVRREFPHVPLMVDANSAYTLADADRLAELDHFALMMIEQPLAHDDVLDHSILAGRIKTPICLDESVHSAEDARKALDLEACRVVNIKSGRLGGLTESVRTHDLCLKRATPVWCGGMLETNIGRAANVALSSLPGFTLPGDVAASARYFEHDVALPNFELTLGGTIAVPEGPGSGVEVDTRRLDQVTLLREEFTAG